jgi:chromosome segregation ATPase
LDNLDELEIKLQTSEEDIEQFDMLKNKLDMKIERLEDELTQVEESEFALSSVLFPLLNLPSSVQAP